MHALCAFETSKVNSACRERFFVAMITTHQRLLIDCLIFSSFHELIQSRGVCRLSVCLSVRKLFAQIASTTRQMARLQPNLHTMVSR